MSKQFQHEDFFCIATRCWHATVGDLRYGKLFDAFGEFVRRFPDHPNADNTHLYLLFRGDGDVSPPSWGLSWCCSHFEHDHRNDVVRLVEFMDLLATFGEHDLSATHLERLADERVHLRLYNPAEDVRQEILRYGHELEEWRPAPGPVDPETASLLRSMLRLPEQD